MSDPARPTGVPERLTITARNLPHWQRGGCSYFITFCLVRGTLSPAERKLVLDACRHWDGQRMELHAAVVMPDHAHLILSPFEKSPDVWWPMSEIMHSIKSFTSHEIGKARGERGQIWQDESHDRLIRDNEYADTMAYVLENPVKAGLVRHWLDYPFTWTTDEARAGRLRFAERVRGPQFPGEAERRKQEEEKAGEGVGTGGTPVPRAESRKAEAGDGDLRFHPDRYAKTYQAWHEGIRDWCISRQLWWGHRIPVWHKKCRLDASTWSRELAPQAGPSGLTGPTFGDMIMGVVDEMDVRFVRADTGREVDPTRMVPLESGLEGEYDVFVCPRTDVDATKWQLEKAGFTRDPDVLDTWFSSALWPTSTMGWPDDTDLLRAFNPTDVLCTAREIITLWVSRMVMFERYLMPEDWADRRRSTPGDQQLTDGRGRGPLPFRDVFIHAMIQDGEGRKMSKSLGNGVDPLDIIASHGADAMRFTLCNMATHTQDVRMPVEKDPATGRNTSPKFDLGRNLCNKLWNAARFALGILEARDERTQSSVLSPQSCSLVDRWMLSRLAAGVAEINGAVERYEFAAYAQAVYDLLWRDFCDWYLEAIKPTAAANPAQRAVLAHALEVIVRVLHPIAPFVTEAIWERLSALQTPPIDGISLGAARKTGLLCTAGWPEVSPSLRDTQAEQQFERIRGLITAVREVRAMHNVPPKRKVLLHTSPELDAECRRAGDLVETLAVLERVTPADPVASAVPFVFEGVRCHLSNLADAVDAGAERKRLEKTIADADKTIKTLEGRLSNPGYADKAPAAMVQQTRDQLAKARAEREAAARALERVA